MKQVTLDYETYTKELRDAIEAGRLEVKQELHTRLKRDEDRWALDARMEGAYARALCETFGVDWQE